MSGFHQMCLGPDQLPQTVAIASATLSKALSTKCLRRYRTHRPGLSLIGRPVGEKQNNIQLKFSTDIKTAIHDGTPINCESNTLLFAVLAIQSD
jgi:hypothetical protein